MTPSLVQLGFSPRGHTICAARLDQLLLVRFSTGPLKRDTCEIFELMFIQFCSKQLAGPVFLSSPITLPLARESQCACIRPYTQWKDGEHFNDMQFSKSILLFEA